MSTVGRSCFYGLDVCILCVRVCARVVAHVNEYTLVLAITQSSIDQFYLYLHRYFTKNYKTVNMKI